MEDRHQPPTIPTYPHPLDHNPWGVTLIVIACFFRALAVIAICLRLWSRRIQGGALVFNDYAVLLAWPLSACLVVTTILLIPGGGGKHVSQVDPRGLPAIFKVYIAAEMLWAAANTAVKLSILHFYLTIFGPNKRFRVLVFINMSLVAAFGVGIILQALLICRPFAKHWNPMLPGRCGDIVAAVLASSIINVAIDVFIITLPMPFIWRLQMSPFKKSAITATFGFGFVVCIVTSLRIYLSTKLDIADFTWSIAKIAIVTDLEPILGIIVACLPLAPPVYKRVTHGKPARPSANNFVSSTVARIRSKGPKLSSCNIANNSLPISDLNGSIVNQGNLSTQDGVKKQYFQTVPVLTLPIQVEQQYEVQSEHVA